MNKLVRDRIGKLGDRAVEGFVPQAVWRCFSVKGYSGYSRLSREMVLRLSNSVKIQLVEEPGPPMDGVHSYFTDRLAPLSTTVVEGKSPMVRATGPRHDEAWGGWRVCYTMMETCKMHRELVAMLRTVYDEVWTPTTWNLEALKEAGLSIPGRVMPLGVDPLVFRPLEESPKPALPPCELLTTGRAGAFEQPEGFVFVSLFQPTFRKGADVLIRAFRDAFHDDPSAALVLAVTHQRQFEGAYINPHTWRDASCGARVYALRGRFTDWELSEIYRACDAYATATRGEGWNLPLTEAAACGLPVIAPNHTAHTEYLRADNSFLFEPDGEAAIEGSGMCSRWFDRMPFKRFGAKAHGELVSLLRTVRKGGPEVRERAGRLSGEIRTGYTWDTAAFRVGRRITELCLDT